MHRMVEHWRTSHQKYLQWDRESAFFPYSIVMLNSNKLKKPEVASLGKTLNSVFFLLTLIRKYKTTDQLFNTWRKHFFKNSQVKHLFQIIRQGIQHRRQIECSVTDRLKSCFPNVSKSNYLGPIGNKIITWIWNTQFLKSSPAKKQY